MKEKKRRHGIEAAGAGDLGQIPDDGETLGACPGCDAELKVSRITNPRSGRVERALLHPVPFCTYFGRTDADVIKCVIAERTRSR